MFTQRTADRLIRPHHLPRSTPNRTRIQLAPGGLWRAESRSPIRIQAVEGQYWLTRAGDPRDYLLLPGQSCQFEDPRGLVVQALGRGGVLEVERG